MTTPEILSLVWIGVAAALTVGFAYVVVWLDERAERRKAHSSE
jgi:hypothetical protein